MNSFAMVSLGILQMAGKAKNPREDGPGLRDYLSDLN